VLVELANRSVSYDHDVAANPFWVSKAQTDRAGLYRLIRDTILADGSVFRGENSVIGTCRDRPLYPDTESPVLSHRQRFQTLSST
jgi:hypothetical protein